MPESEYGIVKVGEAVDGWWWEHFLSEVGDSIGTWGSVFHVFDYFGDIAWVFSDFRTGRESVCVLVGEFEQTGTEVWRGKMRRELLFVGCG